MDHRVKWFLVLIGLGLCASLIFFIVKPNDLKEESLLSPTNSQSQGAQVLKEDRGGCTRVFSERILSSALVETKNQQAIIAVKDMGELKVDLYDKDAPQAVENFIRLAKAGFYDCLTFHRIAKGFVVQGGDPEGDGTGGRTASGKPLPDELNPDTLSYKQGYLKGVVAMANRGLPNTGTSQFFIMLGDGALDHSYTIFGRVVEGLEILDRIGEFEVEPVLGPQDGSPKTPVMMEKVTVLSK